MIGSNQTIPPMRLRVRRATSRARLTSEYSTAATGPRRPLHRMTSGSTVNAQNHSGCRNRIMRRRLAGLQHETASALEERFHIRDRQRGPRKFDEVALLQKLRQQRAVTRERFIRALQQRLQELLGGSLCCDDVEALLDVVSDHLGCGDAEFPRRGGTHQRSGVFQALQGLLR